MYGHVRVLCCCSCVMHLLYSMVTQIWLVSSLCSKNDKYVHVCMQFWYQCMYSHCMCMVVWLWFNDWCIWMFQTCVCAGECNACIEVGWECRSLCICACMKVKSGWIAYMCMHALRLVGNVEVYSYVHAWKSTVDE